MLSYLRFPPWLRPEIIPGLPLRWYGLMYLAAFAVSYYLVQVQVRRKKLPVEPDTTLNLFFWAIVGLLVGARALAVTVYDPAGYYLDHPLQIILPFAWEQGRLVFTGLSGMSYHGGLLGTVVACVIYLRVRRLDVLEWADMMVAGVPLGYTFGRLGNFINGELYGRVTTAPWGMIFPQASGFSTRLEWVRQVAAQVGLEVEGQASVNLPRHPSQLYEAFFEGIFLWAVLWFLLRKRRPFKGFLLASYLIGYGLIRFIIEYFRQPDSDIGFPIEFVPVRYPGYEYSLLNFTTGQILCALMIVSGIVLLLLFRRRARQARPIEETRRSSRKLRKKLR